MILVFGKTGQIASELQRLAGVVALGREEADLSKPQACADAIRRLAPKAVINAAAYTAVDKAEKNEELASVINGNSPILMAKVCKELDIPFVHISTDYVFGGAIGTPWTHKDPTAPQNAYGRSKLLGENGIRANCAVYAILRTSWVISEYGSNFVKTMLHLSKTRNMLEVVNDQIGGPTPARDIADACFQITDQLIKSPSKSGTYHFSGFPDVSWAELANKIFEQAGRSVTVVPVETTEYPTPAPRPLNSRLDCNSTKEIFGISRPDWRLGLKLILNEL